MNLTRRSALALTAAGLLLPSCASGNARVVRVGSKNFTEAIVVAEIYAQALERAGLSVERAFDLGSVQIAMAALQRGDIDLYPEYTSTGLVDVLHIAPSSNAQSNYRTVRDAYAKRYDLVWLDASPLDDTQALATTAAISQHFKLTTLSQCAVLAPQLRLATIAEFLARPDGLEGLQKFYGGFQFKSVQTYAMALKYHALLEGADDVALAFTTDAAILGDKLVVLRDDRNFWPPYNIAPVVRHATLTREPKIARVLNALAPSLTTAAARRMNAAVDIDHRDPAEVAAEFLKTVRA
jgi:osmoprotectant transport system substrate-binding protein